MPQAGRTFRIFVSSTFSDLVAERDALQRYVFPRLRELCQAHGTRFQAIDLRWGVSEEASLDQQTVRICLEEIARCQRVTPRPNFLILLGDRYGWQPLPEEVPADELEALTARMTPEERSLLVWDENEPDGGGGWYRRDDNAVPPAYVLQPRTGACEDWTAFHRWVERPLLDAMRRAAAELDLAPEARLKYEASATHQEIERGLEVEDADQHVFGFFRGIANLEEVRAALSDTPARDYLDTDAAGRFDAEAHSKLEALKAGLRQRLGRNVREYRARWTGAGLTADHIGSLPDDLAACQPLLAEGYEPRSLCEAVYQALGRVILSECEKLEEKTALQLEVEAHETFAQERRQQFVGREQILAQIAGYLAGDSSQPLAVWGESGTGKTALMAEAIHRAQAAQPDAEVVYRFIGATPDSTSGRALLEGLCRQVSEPYGADASDLPTQYEDLVAELPKRLALATAEKPLLLFLDALDQLSSADNAQALAWLPRELPPHVRPVVSTLPGKCLDALTWGVPEENRLQLEPMPAEEGERLLGDWLTSARRTLQPEQRAEVLLEFGRCGLPLYLRLAFEEARRWRSFGGTPDLGSNVPGILENLFRRLSNEANHGAVLVSHSLAYLAAAKNGLTEGELLDVLALDPDVWDWFLSTTHQVPQYILPLVKACLLESQLPPEDKPATGCTEAEVARWLDTVRKDKEPAGTKRRRELVGALLGRGKGTPLPIVLWSRLCHDLEPYLAERAADRTLLLGFYHRQVGEKVAADFLPEGVRSLRHRALAQYFGPQALQPEGRPNVRKLSEQPYQQTNGQLWGELGETLTDFDFLEAKCRAVSVYDLQADYRGALRALPAGAPERPVLAAFEERLRLESHRIARAPELLFPQMYNHLTWLDAPADAEGPGGPIHAACERGRKGRKNWLRWVEDPRPAPPPWMRSMEGSTGWVNAVAITPDGATIVSGSEDKAVKIWDLATGCLLRSLTGHNGTVWAVTVSPDGVFVVSGSSDRTLKVWDLASGRLLRTLEGHTHEVHGVVVTPDGASIISGSRDATVKVWDLASGRLLRSLACGSEVWAIAATADGRTVVSGSWDGTVKAWDLATGRLLRSLKDGNMVRSVAITPDGQTLVSGRDSARTVKVWDLATGNLLHSLEHHWEVGAVAIAPDGMSLVSGEWDGTIKVWDLATGHLLCSLEEHRGGVIAVAVAPNGESVVSGSSDRTIKVWDLANRRLLRSLEGHTDWVNAVSVTPDGAAVVSGSNDQTVKVWDLATGRLMRSLQGHTDRVCAVAVTPDGAAAISGSEDKSVMIWNLATGRPLRILAGHVGAVMAVAVSGDGASVVSGSTDRTVRVWDLATDSQRTLDGHAGPVCAVALTPDGTSIVSGSEDGTVKVWDLSSGRLLRSLDGHTDSVNAVAVTPDGAAIVSGSSDRTIKVWHLNNGRLLRSLEGHATRVDAVALARGGTAIISGSWDKTVKVWDFASGCLLRSLEGHTGQVCSVATTPDSAAVISGSFDLTIKVWDLDCSRDRRSLEGHTSAVGAMAVTLDGTTVISGSDDCTVKVWDAANGRLLRSLEGHESPIASVVVTPDGSSIVSGSDDFTAKIWDLATGRLRRTLVHTGPVASMALLPDGKRIVSGSLASTFNVGKKVMRSVGTVRVWRLASGRLLRAMEGVTRGTAVAISPDGMTLVCAKYHEIAVLDFPTARLLRSLPGHTDEVCTVAVTPDGTCVFSASEDKSIKVWDLASGDLMRTLKGHAGAVRSLVVTPDGRSVFSASDDHTIRLWNRSRGAGKVLLADDVPVRCLALSRDGRWLVAGDDAGRVWIFEWMR